LENLATAQRIRRGVPVFGFNPQASYSFEGRRSQAGKVSATEALNAETEHLLLTDAT
jgi:hypothetical protein